MAIDTLSKRESALLDGWPVILPDGTIDASDRMTLLGLYSGIAAGAGLVGVPPRRPTGSGSLMQPDGSGGLTRPGARGSLIQPETA